MRQRRRAAPGAALLSVSKKSLDFFDTLSDILTCVKMFLTVRESGGSPGLRWLRPKASGLPPAVQTPFHTIPPLLLQPGPSFSTV